MKALLSASNVLDALNTNLSCATAGTIYSIEDGVHKKIDKNIDVFQSILETAKAILGRVTTGRATTDS